MKRITMFVAALCVGSLTSTASHADTNIGNCRFIGDRPSHQTSIGTMNVYHNGTLRLTGSRGNQNIYEVNGGTIWVIYADHAQKEKYVFLGGSIQTCDDNIR